MKKIIEIRKGETNKELERIWDWLRENGFVNNFAGEYGISDWENHDKAKTDIQLVVEVIEK